MVSNPQREDSCSRDMIVSDSAFLSNEGGGLVVFNGNLALTDSNFTGNTGTAVYFETSQEDTSFNLEVGRSYLGSNGMLCVIGGCMTPPSALFGGRGRKFG